MCINTQVVVPFLKLLRRLFNRPSHRHHPTASLRRMPRLPRAEFPSPRTAAMSETMWNERTRHLYYSSHSCNSGPTPPLPGSRADNRQPENPFKPLVSEKVRVSEEWIGSLQSPDHGIRSCLPSFAGVWCCLGSLTMSKHEYRGDRDGEMMVVGSKLGFGLAFAVIMLAEEKPPPALLDN